MRSMISMGYATAAAAAADCSIICAGNAGGVIFMPLDDGLLVGVFRSFTQSPAPCMPSADDDAVDGVGDARRCDSLSAAVGSLTGDGVGVGCKWLGKCCG